VAKPEWGTKRTCLTCGTKFYDLKRSPIVCPKCSATLDADAPVKLRRGGSSHAAAEKALPKPVDVEEMVTEREDEELEVVDDEEGVVDDVDGGDDDESGLIEDASDLGEDDDDMAEVMEHLDENLEDEV